MILAPQRVSSWNVFVYVSSTVEYETKWIRREWLGRVLYSIGAVGVCSPLLLSRHFRNLRLLVVLLTCHLFVQI